MAGFPEGYFYIRSRESGKCIDVKGDSKKNDAKILVWQPKHDSDRDNQLWCYDDGFLTNKHSQKVLDVRGGVLDEKAWIIQYERKIKADAQNQRWGYENGHIFVLAEHYLVLDVKSSFIEDSRVVLHTKKIGLESQLWDIVPANEVRADRELLFEADFE